MVWRQSFKNPLLGLAKVRWEGGHKSFMYFMNAIFEFRILFIVSDNTRIPSMTWVQTSRFTHFGTKLYTCILCEQLCKGGWGNGMRCFVYQVGLLIWRITRVVQHVLWNGGFPRYVGRMETQTPLTPKLQYGRNHKPNPSLCIVYLPINSRS